MFGFKKKSKKAEPKYHWLLPHYSILPDYTADAPGTIFDGNAIAQFITAAKLPCTLADTKVGASVATYHFNLKDVLQIKKVNSVIAPLEASLNCDIILGKSNTAHFSLTVPRKQRETVHLKIAMMQGNFRSLGKNDYNSDIPICLGTDAEGKPLCLDLAKLPHMIVSGATGSGKSVLVNSIITSIIFGKAPSQAKLVLIDPKMTEFHQFSGVPHLFHPIITETQEAISTLEKLCILMDQRYAELSKMGKRDIEGTNYSRIVVVIDELADLMDTSKSRVEEYITRLAQKARAAGIHIIVATQQPNAQVLTKRIRGNIPCKIALKCASHIDSRISLGYNGAEKLLGRGDSLLVDPADPGEFRRFQSAWISQDDIRRVVHHWQTDGKQVEADT